MAEDPTTEAATNGDGADTSPRERSKIVFPYGDLEDALAVAGPIYAKGGNEAEIAQLSAWMSESVDSPVFRRNVGVARFFILIQKDKDRVSLTPTGQAASNQEPNPAALSKAFLAVPLYRK